MKESDFYELKIGQEIWYKGEKLTVFALRVDIDFINLSHKVKRNEIILKKESKMTLMQAGNNYIHWDNLYQDCSLTPPVERVKYYRWRTKEISNSWRDDGNYISEDGLYTNGGTFFNWENLEKHRISSDWIYQDGTQDENI